MKQTHFVQLREDDWDRLQYVLDSAEANKRSNNSLGVDEFIRLYRDVARDLAVARSRNYSNELVNRLNELTVRGHNAVYQNRSGWA
ncbi:MAG: stage II sporulation protein M, partial [Gammaproteobacteria bacterium]|nr:stage II sporulation protein M [Gammaproteobacteria bacterium]